MPFGFMRAMAKGGSAIFARRRARGSIVCEPFIDLGAIQRGRDMQDYRCLVRDRIGRRAEMNFIFFECSHTSVRFLFKRLRAFRVDESRRSELFGRPCPGDDLELMIVD
jgi:hypothetical protein